MLAGATAYAQETESGDLLGEVTVTGTRVVRDGYEAPTPVSVLSIEELQASPTTNLTDSVVRLPALSGSTTSHNMATDLSGGVAGANLLNLRSLGTARTLVLLDGRRMVGSVLNSGAADVNSIPSALVQRVDVVTGGASAAYGSDALTGVVNFILDKEFTGMRGNAEGGVTSKGDGGNYRVSLAGGTRFGSDRGHMMLSFEHAATETIPHNNRSWAETSYHLINNPAWSASANNGQPRYLNTYDVGPLFTPGGLINGCAATPCPLTGTQFIQNGAPIGFEYGTRSVPVMVGGDWRTSRVDQLPSLTLETERNTAFGRASFDLTDNVAVFTELQWSSTRSMNPSQLRPFDTGLTIQADNAFLPESIREQMIAQGIPSLTLGTSNGDLPMSSGDHTRDFSRLAFGIEGGFSAGDTQWSWDAFAARSRQDIVLRAPSSRVTRFYRAAIDAVYDSSGRIACRVNVDADPANDMPDCVPYNAMGIGVNSPQAIGYVIREGRATMDLEQDFFAASLSGEPFSTWAGPVSVALGAEHRRESVDGWSSELDQANSFFAGNWHASQGKYNVSEGFLETVVPLAQDAPLARSLDLNGAVRWTDYSTSGEVVTWKAGATWAPLDDVRFRVTRSRDIRAPTLGELYNAGQSGTTNLFDPVMNVTRTIQSQTRGNVNLEPEEADTTGLGVVFTPGFLPGFAASIDYYNIEIEGAIATLGSEQLVTRCAQGVTALCSFIERDANGFVTFVNNQPANILGQEARGYDVEMSYRMPASIFNARLSGDLTFRALGTYFDKLETNDTRPVEGSGINTTGMGIGGGNTLTSPKHRYLVSAAYRGDQFSTTLTMRGVSSGKYNNDFLVCSTDCPTSTLERPTINSNHIAAVKYFDISMNYRLMQGTAETYLAIENFLDEDPPLISGRIGTGFIDGQNNATNYDRLGRQYRLGVRVNF